MSSMRNGLFRVVPPSCASQLPAPIQDRTPVVIESADWLLRLGEVEGDPAQESRYPCHRCVSPCDHSAACGVMASAPRSETRAVPAPTISRSHLRTIHRPCATRPLRRRSPYQRISPAGQAGPRCTLTVPSRDRQRATSKQTAATAVTHKRHL